jgi:hypothetical protein
MPTLPGDLVDAATLPVRLVRHQTRNLLGSRAPEPPDRHIDALQTDAELTPRDQRVDARFCVGMAITEEVRDAIVKVHERIPAVGAHGDLREALPQSIA